MGNKSKRSAANSNNGKGTAGNSSKKASPIISRNADTKMCMILYALYTFWSTLFTTLLAGLVAGSDNDAHGFTITKNSTVSFIEEGNVAAVDSAIAMAPPHLVDDLVATSSSADNDMIVGVDDINEKRIFSGSNSSVNINIYIYIQLTIFP